MNNKNKLSYILSLYYKYEFIEVVERTDGEGKCITREFILASDLCKYLNKIYHEDLFKRNLYVVEILSTSDNDYGTRTVLVVREDKNYES